MAPTQWIRDHLILLFLASVIIVSMGTTILQRNISIHNINNFKTKTTVNRHNFFVTNAAPPPPQPQPPQPLFYRVQYEQHQNISCPYTESSSLQENILRCCGHPVVFLGGMKCGSTSLAMIMKHRPPMYLHYDIDSGFVDAGKEPCTSRKMSSIMHNQPQPGNPVPETVLKNYLAPWPYCNQCPTANAIYRKVLEGCVFYHTVQEARALRCVTNQPRIIVLLRDPIERVISQYNDPAWERGLHRKGIDRWALEPLNLPGGRLYDLGDYATKLENWLQVFPRTQFMIFEMSKMTEAAKLGNIELVQSYYDRIAEFAGLRPLMNITRDLLPFLTAPKTPGKVPYQWPREETVKKMMDVWRPSVVRLMEILNTTLDWMPYTRQYNRKLLLHYNKTT